jgi:two-component system, response regulator PdtaR
VVVKPESGLGPKGRVLVVEDEFLIALTLEDALASDGYVVIGVAATYEEAVELAGAERPDLAIMDIRLASERDGIEAAIELRRRFDVPSLFASANLDPHSQARAAEARPAGWLSKPYTPEKLLAAVERAVSG